MCKSLKLSLASAIKDQRGLVRLSLKRIAAFVQCTSLVGVITSGAGRRYWMPRTVASSLHASSLLILSTALGSGDCGDPCVTDERNDSWRG